MARFERAALLKTFRDMARRGEPIVGGGAGTGLSAKCEEAGGVDLIVIYNSGRYRMAGRGSLAGLVVIQRTWCWREFLALAHPLQAWAIDALTPWLYADDEIPWATDGEKGDR